MSYKYISDIVLLDKLDLSGDYAKANMFETFDQIRNLTVSGPTISGAGLGPLGNFFFKMAQVASGANFMPLLGTQSVNIPGTAYFSPTQPGTGVIPGGQSSFGFGPMSQMSGFPTSGFAAGFDPTSILASYGLGGKTASSIGIGKMGNPFNQYSIGGTVAGGAAAIGPIGPGTASLGIGSGMMAAAGFGRNWIMPAAGIVSGIGGVLTTLAPLLGPASSIAGIASGTILSGFSGSLMSAYQHVSGRILVNADTILENKVKNIETVVKEIEAQEEVVKKLLKDSLDGDKKAMDNL